MTLETPTPQELAPELSAEEKVRVDRFLYIAIGCSDRAEAWLYLKDEQSKNCRIAMLTGRNENKQIFLILAIEYENTDMVRGVLNTAGKDGIRPAMLMTQDMWGSTPLIWVCMIDHTDQMKVILAAAEKDGIRADLQMVPDNDGNIALMHAAMREQTENVEVMLAAADKDGNLLDLLTHKNKGGQTVFDLAKKDTPVYALLEQAILRIPEIERIVEQMGIDPQGEASLKEVFADAIQEGGPNVRRIIKCLASLPRGQDPTNTAPAMAPAHPTNNWDVTASSTSTDVGTPYALAG